MKVAERERGIFFSSVVISKLSTLLQTSPPLVSNVIKNNCVTEKGPDSTKTTSGGEGREQQKREGVREALRVDKIKLHYTCVKRSSRSPLLCIISIC